MHVYARGYGTYYPGPIKRRIDYTTILMAFLAIHMVAPTYIDELLWQYHPVRHLSSSNLGVLPDGPRYSHKMVRKS